MKQEIIDIGGKKRVVEINANLNNIILLEYISAKEIIFTDGVNIYKTSRTTLRKNTPLSIRLAMDQTIYFKNMAKLKHENFYSYEKTEYKKTNEKIIITCPIHGDFLQRPSNHLNGKGCEKCGIERTTEALTSTLEERLIKFKDIHGDKYDYSLVEVGYGEAIIKIICKKHGIFEQRSAAHQHGRGCRRCAYESKFLKRTISKDDFIKDAQKTHNNYYDYSLVEYKTLQEKIKIGCPVHEVFEQTGVIHRNGSGCSKCGDIVTSNKRTYTVEENIAEMNRIHDNRYDYSKVGWAKRQGDPVQIACPLHGEYFQTIDAHIKGTGCPTCSIIIKEATRQNMSFEEAYNIPCFVYVYEFKSTTENFYKVGFSYNPKSRESKFNKKYKVNQLFTFKSNLVKSVNIEHAVLRMLKQFQYSPEIYFDGRTECFKIDPTETVKKFINDLQEQE